MRLVPPSSPRRRVSGVLHFTRAHAGQVTDAPADCRLADSGLAADALVSVPSCVGVDAPGLGGLGRSGLSDLHFAVRARTP